LENNTTSFLVRSTATGWKRASVLAVDAGVHLAAIVDIIKSHPTDYTHDGTDRPITLINGPFAGLEIPHVSPEANAAHITRMLVETYVVTHPHLDHISGFVVNTASLPGSRPKRLAGLPSTIEAFKTHIFNNVIWPNLSDENHGAGLVTYLRLNEGGSPALGEGLSKGYIEVCEGLNVKTWGISHGHCIEAHTHRGSSAGLESNSSQQSDASPRLRPRVGSQLNPIPRSGSNTSLTPGDLYRMDSQERMCVYDSSAYFIQDTKTRKEILIFGDVEPDSLSLSPRNRFIWGEAAPKIVSGRLRGIFIECSFDNSQTEDRLYGHMAPRYLIEELKSLAYEVEHGTGKVAEMRSTNDPVKLFNPRVSSYRTRSYSEIYPPISPRSQHPLSRHIPADDRKENIDLEAQNTDGDIAVRKKSTFPLKGLRIVIIHVKDRLTDGPGIGETIMKEMQEYEEEAQLGCEFILSKAGQTLYF